MGAGTLEVVGRSGTQFDARAVAQPSSDPSETEATEAAGDRSPRSTRWSRVGVVVALLVAAALVSVVVRRVVYPGLSWNRDEANYLWQVRGLRAGELLTTAGATPQFFQPWLTGLRDGEFFSQYTLGWPGLMTIADVLFGSPVMAMVWGTVLAVLGTYLFTREVTRDHTLAVVTAVLLLASPMLITQSGVYLGYLFSLGLGLLFGTALFVGLRRRQSWWFVGAGALLGVLVITRPFDAALWAVVMGGYAVFTTWREWARQVRAAALVFVGLVPFFVLTLVHNRIVTGSFTQFPFTAKEPLDKFGFGYRRLMPGIKGIDYTIVEGVKGTGLSGFYVPQFLVGSYVAVAIAAVGLWFRRRDRTTLLLLGMMVAFPAGYFMFWGNRLASGFAYLSGPVYFVPLFVPLCIFTATVLLRLWRHRRGLLVGLVCALVLATIPFLYDKAQMNHNLSAAQVPWRDAVAEIPDQSLVIVRDSGPYLLHLNPFSRNSPDLDGPILYAVDRGSESIDLIERHPDRTPYMQITSNAALADAINQPDAVPPEISMVPITVHSGPAVTFRVQVRKPAGASAVVVTLQVGSQVQQRTLTADRGGRYTTEFTVVPATAVEQGAEGAVPVSGRGRIAIVAAAGADPSAALGGRQIRERFTYRVHDDEVQVLAPSRKTVTTPVEGRIVQRDVITLSTLAVSVVAP
jgi:hypothetical protein